MKSSPSLAVMGLLFFSGASAFLNCTSVESDRSFKKRGGWVGEGGQSKGYKVEPNNKKKNKLAQVGNS